MSSPLTDKALRAVVGTLPAHGETLSITVVAAADNSAVLAVGQQYAVTCTEDCYICASATAGANDADSSDEFLPANTKIIITPRAEYLYISAIRKSADGVLTIAPRGANYKDR